VDPLSSIAKYSFDGARIQYVEKQFIETLGKSRASGLSELFSQNEERAKAIIHNGQKHHRKFFALGRYLTLLGEISLKRGIYQSNKANRSICPLEVKLKYLQRNRRRMNYFELQQNKLPIGSGVVEAACNNLNCARMKKSGMRWTINGGQTVLTLRSLISSNRWEHFWMFFVNRHFHEFAA